MPLKRVLLYVLIALVITLPGSLTLMGAASDASLWKYGLLTMMPGIIASMLISNNVHSFSPWVAIIVSVVLWTSIIALLFHAFNRKKSKHGRA